MTMTSFATHAAQTNTLNAAIEKNDFSAIRAAANVILDAPRAPTYYVTKSGLRAMLRAMKKFPDLNVKTWGHYGYPANFYE
jgi:hypothetical protein